MKDWEAGANKYATLQSGGMERGSWSNVYEGCKERDVYGSTKV